MNGYVELDKRSGVWRHYWREDGKKCSRRLGKLDEIPNKYAAILKARAGDRRVFTFNEAAALYQADRMPGRKSTSRGYLSKLKLAADYWGPAKLHEIRAIDLYRWFKDLTVAPTSKAKLKFVMGQVFRYAMMSDSQLSNPLDLVHIEGSSKRLKKPRVLTAEQCRALLNAVIREPFHTMLMVAMCLGIRRSEIAGLRWSAIDWDAGNILIERAVVDGVEGDVKTEASRKKLPMALELQEVLCCLRRDSEYVFCNPVTGRPYDMGSVLREVIQPAAERVGLGKIGFHTLRHTYRALLGTLGTPVDVQKNLLRHADIRTTLVNYGGTLVDDERAANNKVANLLIN